MTLVLPMLLAQVLGLTKYHFVYVSLDSTMSVAVAGTFNGWNKDANPMKVSSDGKTWSLDLDIKFGRHQYKFVRNGSEWIVDPKAIKNEDDGNGNINSVLIINPPDFINTAKRGDGNIASSAIEHTTALPYFNLDGTTGILKVRTRKGDVDSVSIRSGGKSYPGTLDSSDDYSDTYRAEMPWDGKANLDYKVEITDGAKTESRSYSINAKTFHPFVVPTWVENSVIYQIFPDRFANGDVTNDPKNVMAWDAQPTYSNRFGGDAAGVAKHIGYLKGLGVNAVYFNPIFQSPSNHRYEADDYKKVDPEIGTNAEFVRLTKGLKQQGIATILDFAFNHTSIRNVHFKDLVKNGANSQFRDWYFPKNFPVIPDNPSTYEAWSGFGSMPKLNTANPATSKYLLDVCQYWLRDVGIDGMRLDVANEVDPKFWRMMRPFAKSLNNNAWIIGEIWGDGNPWLQGDQFDSVMNYQFRDAAIRFVAHNSDDATQFAANLTRVNKSYPAQVSRNMMNLLSSHDTPRFLTECGGDKDLAKLGAALQFTWIGEPSIYYGEEIGMVGGKDPDNRRGMEWSKATQDNDMLAFYKRLIAVRHNTKAFSAGDATFVSSDKEGGMFSRVGAHDAAMVLFNRSSQPKQFQVRVPKAVEKLAKQGLFDAFTGTGYSAPARPFTVNVKPKSFVILVTNSSSNSSLSIHIGNIVARGGRGSVQRRANLSNRSTKQS